MKKTVVLMSSMIALLLAGCAGTSQMPKNNQIVPVELDVTTTWSGTDGNSATYQHYINRYMKENGTVINDSSGDSDETFKKRVLMDFEVGGEPDVLFYFNGSDADPFIKAGKVVPLSTIRAEYPDYVTNLDDAAFVPSGVDGKVYAVPVYGYWEAMYVNKEVCRKAGVEAPDGETTWEEFLQICERIKEAGYTPIAASLAKEPHYWFEFVLYNQVSPSNHGVIPTALDSEMGQAWCRGLSDLKEMYENGFFLKNTLYTSADESFQSFMDGKAAFMVDGSWKLGTILQRAEDPDAFGVTYVPAKGERKNTDIIGGFSSGWYITRKAWDDPEKREEAIKFITFMTSDEVVSDFASVTMSATTLKNGTKYEDSDFCALQKEAVSMLDHRTSIVNAVQDSLSVQSRSPLFDGMSDIVTGKKEVETAMQEFLDLRKAEQRGEGDLAN